MRYVVGQKKGQTQRKKKSCALPQQMNNVSHTNTDAA